MPVFARKQGHYLSKSSAYGTTVIKSFGCGATERLFNRENVRSFGPDLQRTARRKLEWLEAAQALDELSERAEKQDAAKPMQMRALKNAAQPGKHRTNEKRLLPAGAARTHAGAFFPRPVSTRGAPGPSGLYRQHRGVLLFPL